MISNMNSQTEGIYLKLIHECHILIEQIDGKTKLIQSQVGVLEKELTEKSTNTILESELVALIRHLKDVNNSIIV